MTEIAASSNPKAALLLIAGRGSLPLAIAKEARAAGDVHLLALEEIADPQTQAAASFHAPLGSFGAMVEAGKSVGADRVLFIGGLQRPAGGSIVFDDYAKAHFDFAALQAGDDGVLRAVANLFEGAGFAVTGALDVAPSLAVPSGKLTNQKPDGQALCDLQRGLEVARLLGQADVGQAVVVQQGLVLAVEGIEGTDALIERCAALARPGPRPCLIKVAKPSQDLRLDLPTFGPDSVTSLHKAGFAGAFLEAGKALLVDRSEVARRAEQSDLFVEGI